MPLSNVITSAITLDTVRTARAGFGIPLILTTAAEATAASGFSSPTTYVGNDIPGDMLADGFLATSLPHIIATAMMTQTPRPRSVVVAARATAVAGVSQVDVVTAPDGNYTITINGTAFTFVASSSTATLIKDGLIALIPGASGLEITANTVDTDSLDLTADNAGEGFVISVASPASDMVLSVTTPSVGADTDLASLQEVNDTWYCIFETTRLDPDIRTISQYVETREKIFIPQSDEATILTSATTDILTQLGDLQRLRTGLMYHDNDTEAVDGAWGGRMLPTDPGSETWAWQVLNGVPVKDPALTAGEVANIQAKNGNWFEEIGGRNTAMNGRTPEANYLDVIRSRDWIIQNMNLDIAVALQNAGKIPMTQEGIEILRTVVESRLLIGSSQGIVVRESIVVEELFIDDPGDGSAFVSDTDKANRTINLVWRATVQGAIHSIDITGTLSI